MLNNRSNNNQSVSVNLKNENILLRFFYHTKVGRIFLKLLVSSFVTKLLGKLYDSKISKIIIPYFIKKQQIDMSLFIKKKYTSFNDFFMREKIKINVDHNSQAFISPCDSYYSKYHITKNLEVTIKHVNYSLADLLRSKTLAKEYENGQMLIFRLTPRDYHHYHYIDDGIKLSSKKISGVFHTVRPVALVKKVVFIENNREYSVLETKNFGKIIYMEVGALGVGKIIDQEKKSFQKGEEKGCFAFGGSTVILILPANKIKWKYDKYFEKEKYVLCGERI